MKELKHFLLPENTNTLYTKEAISSIALTKDVANKINELVDAYNALAKADLQWKQTQEGTIRKGVLFMKDNLVNSIHDLFELLHEKGIIDDRIDYYARDLRTRLDNLIAANTVDGEIIDGRVGFDNAVYQTIGEAIRSQCGILSAEKLIGVLNLRLDIDFATHLMTLYPVDTVLTSCLFGVKNRYQIDGGFEPVSVGFSGMAVGTYNIVFRSENHSLSFVPVVKTIEKEFAYKRGDYILATLYMDRNGIKQVIYVPENVVYVDGVVQTLTLHNSSVIGANGARIDIDTVAKTISFPSGYLFFDNHEFITGNAGLTVSYDGIVNVAGETVRVVYKDGALAVKKLNDVAPDEVLLMLIWFGASYMTYPERIFASEPLKKSIYFNGQPLIHRKYGSFSVLGDSYSTFEGYINGVNRSYYPNTAAGVTDVSSCWWYIFANDYGCRLLENNSCTGSVISYDGYGTGTEDGKDESFITRMNDLGKPELLIVFGATNDSSVGVALGEYKYDNFTEADFTTFRPSLAYLLSNLKKKHIGCDILYVINTGLSAGIVESINTICEYYGVDTLQLANIEKVDGHPTVAGMKAIAYQIRTKLGG